MQRFPEEASALALPPTADRFHVLPAPAELAALRTLLESSRRALFFTGAGISTESGIPDFRSPGGIWSRMQPIYFQEFLASEEKRRESWRRRFDNRDGWVGAQPNRGHHAVAQLIAAGKASAVITQNVDNLHQVSGVPEDKVIELHGNATYARCLGCALRVELADIEREFQASGTRRSVQGLRRHLEVGDDLVRSADAAAADAARARGDDGVRPVHRARLVAVGIPRGGFSAAREAERRGAGHRQSRPDRDG